ncbi:MAG: hypothetical protein ACRCSF_03625 [Mycobacteriaceae bacterium]
MSGSAVFDIAADYTQRVAAARGVDNRLKAAASVAGAKAVVSVLRSLPVVTADFSDSASGRELRSWFTDPYWFFPTHRIAVSLLPLPGTSAEYLRGKPRQAVRTNIRRSLDVGTTCSVVTDPYERADIVKDVMAQRNEDPRQLLDRPEHSKIDRTFFVARSSSGEALALAETVHDGLWVGLGVLVTGRSGPETRDARYHLHTDVIKHVIDCSAKKLIVGGNSLLFPQGTRYFQHRVGYSIIRLRLP